MSKLEELIQKFCPNGVYFEPLCKCSKLVAGDRITKAMMDDLHKFPVMGGGVAPTGMYSEYNFENAIAISRAGSAGFVNWMGEKFWATDVCFVSRQKENGPIIKFIYYYVKSKQPDLQMKIYGGNLPKLNKDYLWQLPIPVPPIEVQLEIVRILDNFTELTAELTAEFTARKKQYEFYRDNLLIFGDEVEKVKLRSVVSFKNGVGHEQAIISSGRYIVVNSKFISTDGKIKKYTKEQLCPVFAGDILMVMSDLPNGRALAKCFLVEEDNIYSLNQRIGCLTNTSNIINTKFLYYVLNRNTQLLRFDNKVDQTNLRKDDILDILIPVPPIDKQEKIIKALDTFSTYSVTSESLLPAEIAARQKQYEYYRDKLLTFKELKA